MNGSSHILNLPYRGQWTPAHEQAQALFRTLVRKALLDVADKLESHAGISKVEVRMNGNELGLEARFADMADSYNTVLRLDGSVGDWRPVETQESEE
jgi:hypothetical protein